MRTDPQFVGHRELRLPALMRIVSGPEAVAGAIVDSEIPRETIVVVHSGDTSRSGYGRKLSGALREAGLKVHEHVTRTGASDSVDACAAAIEGLSADLVLGVGGGLVVDIAKLASMRSNRSYVSVPTQASSDGICSPVAVIPDRTGRPQSLGARIPTGIVVDMAVLDTAPTESWLAGLGDLVSNLSAVRDWRWAHEQFGEPMDDFACLTAEAAALSLVTEDADLSDAEYRRKLIHGLILSGVAMEMAGSSRPASGSEHLISHALDGIVPNWRAHGLQVAMSSIASFHLRREDPAELIRFFRTVGLPVLPSDLGFDVETIIAAVRRGPSTRPSRRTVLDGFGEREAELLRAALEEDRAHATLV